MVRADSEDLHELASAGKRERMRRTRHLQRAGWASIAALVLAGAAGLFGDGPMSSTTRSADGLTVEFDRFVRRGTPFTLRAGLTVPAGAPQAKLSLSKGYLEGIRISSVMPQPVQAVTGPEGVTFVFAVEPPASALAVTIHYEPVGMGFLDGAFAAGPSRVALSQFVWP